MASMASWPARALATFLTGFVLALAITTPARAAARVDFSRDVLPIFVRHCFRCHGPDADQREAGLRLDQPPAGRLQLKSGRVAIAPGDPLGSALLQRVRANDDERMPPADHGARLAKRDVDVLTRWIAEGAPWGLHWAFIQPRRPPLPQVERTAWPRGAVDHFTLRGMESRGLAPNAEADRSQLIRRASFTLTGLPPTPAESALFLRDRSPDAFERAVERLLSSPRYAERVTLHWLDLARYADTHGYHTDSHRDMWRWRDEVLRAFSGNMPFDQFTIEQLAGDLLPGANLRQKILSGFNRNTMINFENGALAEEYLNEYIIDRVNTTATVWLGQTMRCCRCHDHKHDPLTQRDFYQLYAFFNNVDELGLDGERGNAKPVIRAPTSSQLREVAELDEQALQLQQGLDARRRMAVRALPAWEKELNDERIKPPLDAYIHCLLDETDGDTAANESSQDRLVRQAVVRGRPYWLPQGKLGGALLCGGDTYLEFARAVEFHSGAAQSVGAWVMVTKADEAVLFSQRQGERGWELRIRDGALALSVHGPDEDERLVAQTDRVVKDYSWRHVMVTYDGSNRSGGVKFFVNGELQRSKSSADSLAGECSVDGPLFVAGAPEQPSFRGMIDEVRYYRRQLTSAEVKMLAGGNPVRELLAIAPADRDAEQRTRILDFFLQQRDAEHNRLATALRANQRRRETVERSMPTTMIMRERDTRRTAFVLRRGDYRFRGEPVTADTPAALGRLPATAPANRLGLARWLVARNNPLTARVVVNRFWQLVFGFGLVRTPDDFGVRGAPPTHPELLDWLAVEFVDSGWDVKHLLRLIVTSSTYRQASYASPAALDADPQNRWLARGPRVRLDAEAIRDNALSIAGLLDERVGGRGVFPYQPEGLWREISYNPNDFTAQVYTPSRGRDLYRRSIYTFWKRSAPPPALAAFDAPTREVCIAKRSVTHTPLQVLVLMNDPTFVEASRVLAERVIRDTRPVFADRINRLMQLVLSRSATRSEFEILAELHRQALVEFRDSPADAAKLVGVGASKRDVRLDVSDLAAWTIVASTVFNLNETTTPY
ncbi:MAG: DUF1553 domain-containing protein [Pirellulaceae bacterium]|jgi:hypothetical protein|nr:DUF1553 domain-containing protein [Pirellulaceae bacterium]MDP7018782.1 DUF1553 domain-containing protein [Pirellulaceae bacterium]